MNQIKATIIYLLIGIVFDSVHGHICSASDECNENLLYNNYVAKNIFPEHSTFKDHKKAHDMTVHKINSIEPESIKTYLSNSVQTIKKSELSKLKGPLKAILKNDLELTALPPKIANKIDLHIDLAGFIKKRQEHYLEVDLSGDYGGTAHLGYGVFAFIPDPNDAESVIMGVTAIREEWTEKKNVKLLTDIWDQKDVEKFIVYQLFQRIYPRISDAVKEYITGNDDPFAVDPFGALYCRSNIIHVMFISDKSGSMSSNDDQQSLAEYTFIQQKGYLNNRLGSLFSAIHDFIRIRSEYECNDVITSILFDSNANENIETKIKISETFVKDYLIRHRPNGGTNFGKAFDEANKLIDYDEETIVIFLTDGEASDNGASDIVKNWLTNMSDNLRLLCVVLGGGNRDVVDKICESGNGKVKEAMNGDDIIQIYKDAAKYKMYNEE